MSRKSAISAAEADAGRASASVLFVLAGEKGNTTMSANDPATINCCVCCKAIPLDAAFTPEGAEPDA